LDYFPLWALYGLTLERLRMPLRRASPDEPHARGEQRDGETGVESELDPLQLAFALAWLILDSNEHAVLRVVVVGAHEHGPGAGAEELVVQLDQAVDPHRIPVRVDVVA